MPAAPEVTLELGWVLREQVTKAFATPWGNLRASIQQAAVPPDLVEAADPAHFQRACMLGLASVTDLALDGGFPLPIREALRKLPQHYHELLTVLLPAAQAIAAAGPDLRNIQHIEGMASLLYQATQAANPSTMVGVAAIGGATLGTLLMPGIGTAIGGALGLWLGGSQASKRDRRALERFAAAVKLMWATCDDLENNLWNQLVHSIQEADGPALSDAAYFETANTRWESLKAAPQPMLAPGEPASFLPAVEAYLRDWGPHPEALYIAAQACLPPYRLDLVFLASWVKRQSDLYPSHPGTHENNSRLALEQGDFAHALQAVDQGLALESKHDGLRQARLEVLAAQGRVAEAEEATRLARAANPASTPELALIRGLMRSGRRAEAAERVLTWMRRDGKPALVVHHLKSFPVTAALLADGSIPGSELTGVLSGLAGRIQAVVQRHLRSDGTNSFFGEPSGEKGHNAHEAFLHLNIGENVLFFHDWSLWHNGTTGLVVTTQRLLWKCAWQDPVSLELREVAAEPVTAKGTELHIGNKNIDVASENLAVALARVLHEAGELFREARHP